jgi:CBS domain-containing protein
MKSKIKNIIILIVISFSILIPYYLLRTEHIEKKYIDGIKLKSEKIKPKIDILTKDEASDELIKKIFDEIMSNDSSVAALAFADKYDNFKSLIKSNQLIQSNATVDHIISDIKGKNLTSNTPAEPVVRSYNNGKGGIEKFYISEFNSGKQKAYFFFVFNLDKKTLLILALEALLVICIIIALTGFVISILNKKGITTTIVIDPKDLSVDAVDEKTDKQEKIEVVKARQLDENYLPPAAGTLTDSNSNEMIRRSKPETDIAATTLNSRIFDLFKKLHGELNPESITLYIKKMEGKLSKSYELRDKTFLRIDSSLFDNIKISEINNMKKLGPHIIDNGKKFRLPIVDDESLIGLIEIILKDSDETLDVGKTYNEVKDIAKDIKEFLVINNIMIDRVTGFYSSSYFKMKLSEQIYSAQKIDTNFRLLLLDIFQDIDIEKKKKNTVLKIIYPVIKQSIGETIELFLHDWKIAIIITEHYFKKTESLEGAITKEIAKFKIKLSPEKTIRLKPIAVILDASEADNIKDILNEAIGLFE